jgi:hypothetical protein
MLALNKHHDQIVIPSEARNLLRRSPAVLILLLLFVPFQPELNQPSN